MFGWDHQRKYQLSELNGDIIILVTEKTKKEFLCPIGNNKLNETIKTCLDYLKSHGHKPVMRRVSEQFKQELDEKLFNIEYDEPNNDYVYKVSELVDMSGSDFHNIRNDIRYVQKKYKVKFKPLTKELIKLCIKFEETWYKRRHKEYDNDILVHEHRACLKVLKNYKKLNISGGVLFLNDVFKGFLITDPLSANMNICHFHKADRKIRGTYSISLYEYAKYLANNRKHIKFINFEQDLGLENLRMAKKHKGHHFVVRKYNVTLKQTD